MSLAGNKDLAALCILVLAVIALIVVAVYCAYRHRERLATKLGNIADRFVCILNECHNEILKNSSK